MANQEITLTGMTVANPVAIIPPPITGLVSWAYFGSIFSTDGTNLVAGGPAISNVGSGPTINSNYATCGYQAALSTGWRRHNDGADGPTTYIVVARCHVSSSRADQALIGDTFLYLSLKGSDSNNGNLPTIANIPHAGASYITVPSAILFRAYAMTEPGYNVAGTAHLMDLTAGTEQTLSHTGVIATNNDATWLGTNGNFGSGGPQQDIAFEAIVQGVQMSLSDIQTKIMPSVAAMLKTRGVPNYT